MSHALLKVKLPLMGACQGSAKTDSSFPAGPIQSGNTEFIGLFSGITVQGVAQQFSQIPCIMW